MTLCLFSSEQTQRWIDCTVSSLLPICFYLSICMYVYLFPSRNQARWKPHSTPQSKYLTFSSAGPVEVNTASQIHHSTCLFSSFSMSSAKGHCVAKQIMVKVLWNINKPQTRSPSIPILVLASSSEQQSSLHAEGFGGARCQPWGPSNTVSQDSSPSNG